MKRLNKNNNPGYRLSSSQTTEEQNAFNIHP